MLKQELANKYAAVALQNKNVMIATMRVRLAKEKVMMQNALLHMQQQNWEAWMTSQAGCAPTYSAKPSSKSKTQATLRKGLGKKIVADEDHASSTGLSSFGSSTGLSSSASSCGDDLSLEAEPSEALAKTPPNLTTTVMMRNIPNTLTREMLLQLINTEGFVDCYDFVYLPMDFKKMLGLGYSFINFLDSNDADRFKTHFSGFSRWGQASDKVCETMWSNALQGRDANIERYRNSPVMHPLIPDDCKPLLFKDGERVAFPEPTKQIRAPKPSILGGGRPEPTCV